MGRLVKLARRTLPLPQLLNLAILREPLNWVIVFVCAFLALTLVTLVSPSRAE